MSNDDGGVGWAEVLRGCRTNWVLAVLVSPFATTCFCLFGIPLGLMADFVASHQLAYAVGRKVSYEVRVRRGAAAAMVVAGFAGTVAAAIAADAIALTSFAENPLAIGLVSLGMSFVFAFAAWPLVFVPLVFLDNRQVDGRLMQTALEVASAVPFARRVGLTLLWSSVVPVVQSLVLLETNLVYAVFFIPGLVLPVITAAFVSAYSRYEPRVRHARGEHLAALPTSIRMLAGSAVLAISLLAVALIMTVATPSRLASRELRATGEPEVSSLRISGTSLTVSADPHGIRVEADDGGGAGLIQGSETSTVRVSPIEGGFEVVGQARWREHYARIDANGVRLNDGIADRLTGRVSPEMLVLVFAAVLAFLLAGPVLVWVSRSRGLLDYAGVQDVRESERRILEATLKTGSSLFLQGGRLISEGAELVAGDLRIRIPDKGVVVRGVQEPVVDGIRVCLIGRFSQLSPAARRESHIPFPGDAVLVVGSRQQALDAVVRAGARPLGVLLLLGASLAACAAIGVLISL